MQKKYINANGNNIQYKIIDGKYYLSVLDIIIAINKNTPPRELLNRWLKNLQNLKFIKTWEELNNPKFMQSKADKILNSGSQKKANLTIENWINKTQATGFQVDDCDIFAHQNIAITFTYGTNSLSHVYIIKALKELGDPEYKERNLRWHISKVTENMEAARNLLDNIPNSKK